MQQTQELKEETYKYITATAVIVAGLMFIITLLVINKSVEVETKYKHLRDSLILEDYHKLECLQAQKERIEFLELDNNYLKNRK